MSKCHNAGPHPILPCPNHGCWQSGEAARTDELETYDDSTVKHYICTRWAGEAADCDAPWATFFEARCELGPARETQHDTVRRTMVRPWRRLWAVFTQARAA